MNTTQLFASDLAQRAPNRAHREDTQSISTMSVMFWTTALLLCPSLEHLLPQVFEINLPLCKP
jgi:hypothetical protein